MFAVVTLRPGMQRQVHAMRHAFRIDRIGQRTLVHRHMPESRFEFGAFSVKKRDQRIGRNPRTGEAVEVEDKHVPFFKTGKLLRDRLNGN